MFEGHGSKQSFNDKGGGRDCEDRARYKYSLWFEYLQVCVWKMKFVVFWFY